MLNDVIHQLEVQQVVHLLRCHLTQPRRGELKPARQDGYVAGLLDRAGKRVNKLVNLPGQADPSP